jgi:large subunit ribosomal protein L21
MFAVIKTGGQQFKVKKDDIIRVQKLDVPINSEVNIEHVLMVNDGSVLKIGSPVVSGSIVKAIVVDHIKDDKVIIFKKIRRHNYRRKKGHRQPLTVLKICSIN